MLYDGDQATAGAARHGRSAGPGLDAHARRGQWAALDSEIRESLRSVVDPEINIDVVTLGLIREIIFHPAETEVQMILTTPFCPYAIDHPADQGR
ncbi:MAG: iron-sulfur cluster assembly protein [Anaerolineae bacterium]